MFQSNEGLRRALLKMIIWQSLFHAADKDVTAKFDVANLASVVDSYSKKSGA